MVWRNSLDDAVEGFYGEKNKKNEIRFDALFIVSTINSASETCTADLAFPTRPATAANAHNILEVLF